MQRAAVQSLEAVIRVLRHRNRYDLASRKTVSSRCFDELDWGRGAVEGGIDGAC